MADTAAPLSKPPRRPTSVTTCTTTISTGTAMSAQLAKRATAVAAALLLSACASLSPDGGLGPVADATRAELGKELRPVRSEADRAAVAARVAELSAGQPLGADAAVQIALLNNRRLRADFAELGIAEAELVQADRLPNPGFSFGRLRRGDELEIERGLHFDLARLLALPLARPIEQRRFAQAQTQATLRVLALASETRKAYYGAIAADEGVRYMQRVQQAAEAGAELARRMAEVGNWNKLEQAREHGFYAEAALETARALQRQTAARERLTRLLGLSGEHAATLQLPERLPDLPKAARELPDAERQAMDRRLDLKAARLQAEASARNLGLSKATRFVNVLELGVQRNASNVEPTQRGYEISFELPIFDWSGARVAKAEAIYRQSLEHTAEAALDARSQVREAYLGYRSAYDIARQYRDEIVPLRKTISAENQARYNAMQIGVFELLADARVQIASVNGAIEALRDFWVAEAELHMALIGPVTAGASAGAGGTRGGMAAMPGAAAGDAGH